MKRRVKTPLIFQIENADCGAAALASILGFYGCFIPLPELRQRCGISRDGTHAVQLVKTANHYGLAATLHHETVADLFNLHHFPCILFWKNKHFVILEGIVGQKVYINDPNRGRTVISREALKAHFCHVRIAFKPTGGLQRQKSVSVWKTLNSVFDLKTGKRSFCLLLLTAVLLSLPMVGVPLLTKLWVNHYMQGTEYSAAILIALLTILLFLQIGLIYTQRKILRNLEANLTFQGSKRLVQALFSLPLVFFAHRKIGDLCNRIPAVERLVESFTGPMCTAFFSSLQIMIYLGLMLYISAWLCFDILCIAGLIAALFTYSAHFRERYALQLKQTLMGLQILTTNQLSSIEETKATGKEAYFYQQWQQQFSQYLRAHQPFALTHALLQNASALLLTIATSSFFGIGAYLCLHHQLSVGGLIAFSTIFVAFQEPLLHLVNFGNQFQQLKADLQRILDITQQPTERPTLLPILASFTKPPLLEVVNLTFGYNPLEKPLFHQLNLTIQPGERIVFKGHSGSGKSTLSQLISGLHQPWEGDILVDGVSIFQLTAKARAQCIGLVSQDSFFFEGTIRENLCFWDHYQDEALINALQWVELGTFIEKHGLNFLLQEAAHNLSGGERQRLEIARTLLRKPAILILDEATSALDSSVESKVINNLAQLSLTTISITHRYRAIAQMDKCYVFNQGELAIENKHAVS